MEALAVIGVGVLIVVVFTAVDWLATRGPSEPRWDYDYTASCGCRTMGGGCVVIVCKEHQEKRDQ